MSSPVEDWHGKASGGINQPYSRLDRSMSDYTAGEHRENLELKTIKGEKILIGRSDEGKVSVTVEFGEESATVWVDPSRARQIAASLLNKADACEGIR